MSTSDLSKIKKANQKAPLSTPQKKFNRLIAKIEKKRNEFKQWEEAIGQYQSHRHAHLEPLNQEFDKGRASFVYWLDKAFSEYKLNKREQKKIAEVIKNITANLIFTSGNNDLKPLYDKYSDETYDDHLANEKNNLNEMLKDFLDVTLDDDVDLSSFEDVMMNIGKKIQDSEEAPVNKTTSKKKSAHVLAKEAELKKEEEEATLSIRSIFRSLASVLHPDRAENDTEREQKNAMMQRVNEAYKNRDLLSLLQLQLEIEQITPESVNAIAESKLIRYCNILNMQLQQLLIETDMMIHAFMARNNLDYSFEFTIKPKDLLFLLDDEIEQLELAITDLKNDISAVCDEKTLKGWLKNCKFS